MKIYMVVQTKAGYAVQNTKTYVVVQVYASKSEADKACLRLNE
jgi:hypothetical protein